MPTRITTLTSKKPNYSGTYAASTSQETRKRGMRILHMQSRAGCPCHSPGPQVLQAPLAFTAKPRVRRSPPGHAYTNHDPDVQKTKLLRYLRRINLAGDAETWHAHLAHAITGRMPVPLSRPAGSASASSVYRK